MSEESPLSEQEFASAVELLRELLPSEELNALQPSGPATVYTTLVTLWMMVMQRLGGGKSLAKVVKDVLARNKALFPDNKRVIKGTLSTSSGAYSGARSRLTLETVEYFTDRVCDSLIDRSEPMFDGRKAFTFDGTTITLAPTPELIAAFPPATNQFGESVWPVALLLVAHEMQSSCALPPVIGAMYGENNTSEAKLALELAKQLPRRSLALLDSGFGIFSVCYGISSQGHAVLARLTKSRFKAMVRGATLYEEREGRMTWKLRWTPSNRDRETNPDLPEDASVEVFLHAVPLEKDTLYLVTTLPIGSENAAEYYRRRYDVEHDIRDVKVSLDTESISAKTVEMVKKELLTSIVAYNLVIQFRRQAAEIANVEPRRLSFTGVWNTFESFLLTYPPCSAAKWLSRYEEALVIASKDKLPQRPGRSYPRKAHARRPKSTKFMKKQASTKKNTSKSTSDSS